MKKALEPLIAVCVLASIAQAQFCSTEPTTDRGKASSVFTITEAAVAEAELAAGDGVAANEGNVSLARDIGHPWFSSGFRKPSLDGALYAAPVAGLARTAPLESSDNQFDGDPTNTFTFTQSTPPESTGMAAWLVESGTGMRLQGMLEALEPDVQSMIESQESDAGAATATEARSVPEPTTYGLFGVIALLGLAVARKSSGP